MRSLFLHNVKPPREVPDYRGLRVLKRAIDNAKLTGKRNKITKGPKGWIGCPMFTLTLEEGPTCPADCPMMALRGAGKKPLCYGGNMPFAVRYQHGPALLQALREDLAVLNNKYPRGFVVRLHVLGDFYSVEYVEFWAEMLAEYSSLRIYGYTHRTDTDPIGQCVDALSIAFGDRVAIRRSHGTSGALPLATTVSPRPTFLQVPEGFVLCLHQMNGTPCADCGLCFNKVTNIAFLEH